MFELKIQYMLNTYSTLVRIYPYWNLKLIHAQFREYINNVTCENVSRTVISCYVIARIDKSLNFFQATDKYSLWAPNKMCGAWECLCL